MEELASLAKTAGSLVVGTLTQKRDKPDMKYFIGEGKTAEVHALIHATNADLVIFDHSLTASQQRNLEDEIGVKVIDRVELILDIFAQHARSREGKLQVELAQSQFLMTRLSGHGVAMSRLGGGIGTRGPGETKLEYDRRRIRKKISDLKKELETVKTQHGLLRQKRKSTAVQVAAIIGYTNAGKSCLLNALTHAGVLVQDKLFATLDPTMRRMHLPGGKNILITDTVGFIQKLPHQLIESFRATLEETTEADILLHVVDASSPYMEDQITAVYQVLEELKIIEKPIITVFNKIDKLSKKIPKKVLEKYSPAVAISALKKEGLEDLLKIVAAELT